MSEKEKGFVVCLEGHYVEGGFCGDVKIKGKGISSTLVHSLAQASKYTDVHSWTVLPLEGIGKYLNDPEAGVVEVHEICSRLKYLHLIQKVLGLGTEHCTLSDALLRVHDLLSLEAKVEENDNE
jgi:hypothetical protein